MKKFNIHHTRYDVHPMNATFARFFCNSCNKLGEFSYLEILKGQQINPLSDKDYSYNEHDPKPFVKGEIIRVRLKQYLANRMEEVKLTTRRLNWLDFRGDASDFLDCQPKTITEHMSAIVSTRNKLYRFWVSSDRKKYIVWKHDP